MVVVCQSSCIGILGGGQLGKMLAIEAAYLGYKTAIYDPNPLSPAFDVASYRFNYSFADTQQLERFAKFCQVITYEFENIPLSTLEILIAHGAHIPQSTLSLQIFQNRVTEKFFFKEFESGPVPFLKLTHLNDLDYFIKQNGYPVIIKTLSLGYDGRGQFGVHNAVDFKKAALFLKANNFECIVEKKIDLDHEFSIQIAKNVRGEVVVLGPFENIHKNGILHQTYFPARLSALQKRYLNRQAKIFSSVLPDIGLFTLEYFLSGNTFYINEVAPRVHNSGHGTIEAFSHSQFYFQLASVLGLPFPKKIKTSPFVMTNVLGQHYENVLKNFKDKNVYRVPIKFHFYGKDDAKFNRKMGHFTMLGKVDTKHIHYCETLLGSFEKQQD